MLALHPEYVIDEHQKTKAVLLPFDEWQQLLEVMEELEDIRAYDEAKAQPHGVLPPEHDPILRAIGIVDSAPFSDVIDETLYGEA